MRMDVIFTYFSVCSFVHVQKMYGPVPRMGAQKSGSSVKWIDTSY